jgi:Fe-S-cluster-containing dehydrogenase component
MARYGMVINLSRCHGCYNCFLACRDEFCGNDYPGYSAAQPLTGQFWMKVLEQERGKYPKVKVAYIPVTCMQCDNASCIQAAQNKAVYRRSDGIVIIDPEKSKGQKQLVSACPYRVIYWNEEKQIPQKCTLCAHLLDEGWKEPRCVELCPTSALVFGDLDNPQSEIAKLVASDATEALHPEYGLKEKVSYIGLPKKFVAGTVIYGDKDECAENVTVTLSGKGIKKTAQTNVFGDFEFDGLPDNTDYTVSIRALGYKDRELKAKTRVDVFFGDVVLEKTKK